MAKKTKAEKIWAYKLKNPAASVSETAKATKTSYGYVHKLFSKIGTPKEILEQPLEHNVSRETITRQDILNKASSLIDGSRAAEHGSAVDNFATTAAYWNAHLGIDWILPQDVALMMTLFKIARLRQNEENMDNWLDACGYMALGGEIVQDYADKR